MIILALDALDLGMVKKYQCSNLMQRECGETDISDFNQPRTVVLWASFLTGRNMEAKIPIKTQWEFKLHLEETLLKFFDSYKAVDVPSFSFKRQNHATERKLLKNYFDDRANVEEYDDVVWKHHEENKREFLDAVGQFNMVMGYFNLADAVGHLSFGVSQKMREVYNELSELAESIKDSKELVLIVSDHGMKAVGRYGDHTKNGFYSASRTLGLHLPKITAFYDLIRGAEK
jgi:hypothetical protein